MKLKLNNTEVRIVSDNHEYLFTMLKFTNFSFNSKNIINYFYDNTKVKMLKSTSDIKITDLKMSGSKPNRIILDLQTYSFSITEDIIYYPESKEGNIRSVVASEMPGTDIVLSTKELDKIIELIICIISGLNKIEKIQAKAHFSLGNKLIENYIHSEVLNLHFAGINLVVHDDIIQAEFNNIGLNCHIEEQKFVATKIDITFSPIEIAIFEKRHTKYSSTLLVKGFKLDILDDYKSSKTDIHFENVKLLIYDNHLVDTLKFVADFIQCLLIRNVKSIHDRNVQAGKKKKVKKEQCNLTFKKIVIYCYVDFSEICTIKINDFFYIIDDYMLIPNIKIYHQTLNKVFLMRKVKFLDCTKLLLKFYPEINEIVIDFGKIHVNIYCFELANTILKIYFYHFFFPHWVTFHMHHKLKVDEDYRPKYIDDFAKKNRSIIKFEEVIVVINQHGISNAAILQALPGLVDEKTNMVDYLKGVKCNQFTLNVNNFVLKTAGYSEKETTKDDIIKFSAKKEKKLIVLDDEEEDYFRKSSSINKGNFLRSIRSKFAC
jgi:hypothetical protein